MNTIFRIASITLAFIVAIVLAISAAKRALDHHLKIPYGLEYADITAVDGDPLSDITVMEKVAFVTKGGEVYKPVARNLGPATI